MIPAVPYRSSTVNRINNGGSKHEHLQDNHLTNILSHASKNLDQKGVYPTALANISHFSSKLRDLKHNNDSQGNNNYCSQSEKYACSEAKSHDFSRDTLLITGAKYDYQHKLNKDDNHPKTDLKNVTKMVTSNVVSKSCSEDCKEMQPKYAPVFSPKKHIKASNAALSDVFRKTKTPKQTPNFSATKCNKVSKQSILMSENIQDQKVRSKRNTPLLKNPSWNGNSTIFEVDSPLTSGKFNDASKGVIEKLDKKTAKISKKQLKESENSAEIKSKKMRVRKPPTKKK